jgi:hypothetical protein
MGVPDAPNGRGWPPRHGVAREDPPFGVWVDEPVRPLRPRPPLQRRRRWRGWVGGGGLLAAMIAVGLVAVSVAGSVTAKGLGGSAEAHPPALAAPSLAALNQAIDRAEPFLDGLYKPLGGLGAVQSEHYGLPIRVWFPRYQRWVLLGQVARGGCRPGSCPGLTRIRLLESSYAAEAYELTFATPARDDGLRLRVRVDWAAGPGRYRVGVTAADFRDMATTAEVWLDDVRLGSFSPRPPGVAQPTRSRSFPVGDVAHLRSFRYTVRHATQEAWLYALVRGDRTKASTLAQLMVNAGFVPGRDLRAVIFGEGRDLPQDLGYRHEPFLDAYGDCRLDPPSTPLAYPYRSKACVADLRPYLFAARHDNLLPTVEALQALNRGESPDRPYRDRTAILPLSTTSVSRTADHLEQAFDRLGFGIPRCGPLGCDRKRASALRTFAFGVLESLLGYRDGELSRRPYADAVAHIALAVQIGDDSTYRAGDRVAYRPALRGGFLSYWDRERRFLRPDGVIQSLVDRLNMPPEYLGPKPTDSETTFDAYAFLLVYRCARYGVGCQAWGAIP